MKSHKSLKWNVLAITGTGIFMDFFILSVIIPIIPYFFSNLYGDVAIGALFGSKSMTQMFATLIVGPLIDSQGPSFILFISSLILIASTGLFIFGLGYVNNIQTSYIILIVARSIQGISSAGVTASSMTWVAKEHDPSIHGTAMGITMLGLAAGLALGPPVGGTMSHAFGNTSPFWIALAILIFNLICQLSYHRGYPKKKTFDLDQEDWETTKDVGIFELLTYPSIFVVELGNILSSICIGMLEVLVPLFLMDEFGFDQMHQGLVFGISSLVYLVSTPLSGALSDYIEKWKVFAFGCFMTATGLAMFYWGRAFHIVVIALILTGAGIAFVDSPSMALVAHLASHYGIKNLGSAYALQDLCINAGFALGPLFGPSLSSALGGYQIGFIRTSAVGALILFMYMPFTLMIRTRKDPHRELLLTAI